MLKSPLSKVRSVYPGEMRRITLHVCLFALTALVNRSLASRPNQHQSHASMTYKSSLRGARLKLFTLFLLGGCNPWLVNVRRIEKRIRPLNRVDAVFFPGWNRGRHLVRSA